MSEKKSEIIRFLGLKKFRERLNLKSNQLAKELNASSAVYSNWESGKRDPSFGVVQKLFKMGATVEELFGIPYLGIKPPSEDLMVSKEQAAEIVRVGFYTLIGNSGITQNKNVLTKEE
jgi:transcriptional regulator with XRE-family HTH domain